MVGGQKILPKIPPEWNFATERVERVAIADRMLGKKHRANSRYYATQANNATAVPLCQAYDCSCAKIR